MREKIVHFSTGNGYECQREDTKKYTRMYPILCQGIRVALPKNHEATYSMGRVDCKHCLELLREDLLKKINWIEQRFSLSKTDDSARWVTSLRTRQSLEKAQYAGLPYEPDPEILERLKHDR